MKHYFFYLLIFSLISCKENQPNKRRLSPDLSSMVINDFIFNDDSSFVLIKYCFDEGAFGKSSYLFSILNNSQTLRFITKNKLPDCFENPKWLSKDTLTVDVDWYSNNLKSHHEKLITQTINCIEIKKNNYNKLENSDVQKLLLEEVNKTGSYKIDVYTYEKRINLRDSVMHISISKKNDKIPLYGNLFITTKNLYKGIKKINWRTNNTVELVVYDIPSMYKSIETCRVFEPIENKELTKKINIEIVYKK
jgi:hypothetical protein